MDNERQYFISHLLDDCGNHWLGEEFIGHVRNVLAKLPIDALRNLSEKNPAFFAPHSRIVGRVMRANAAANGLMIYLSPELLSRGDSEIDFVIAHEFAHALLNHEEIICAHP